jgi:hypothetical protein
MTRQAQRAIAQGAASARLFFPGFGWLVFDGARWRHEDVADALDVFLKTCVAPSPGGRVQAAALREALNEWQRLPNLPTWFGKWWGYLNKYFGGSFAS